MRTVVDHLEQRVSDRIGRTPAPIRIPTSAKDPYGCDSKNNGNRFSHDQNAALRVAATIPQNRRIRK